MRIAPRLAAIWCAARLACALDPSLAISQYCSKHWQVEDGLPQNYVTSIGRSRDGYLLVGTSGGVVKFDGIRFTPLVLDARTGLTREWINGAVAAPDGAIWIASRDAGLFRYREGRAEPAGGGRWDFQSLIVTRAGDLAGVGGGTLWRWSTKPRQSIAGGLAMEDLNWCGLAELRDGGLWVATSAGVVRAANGSARVVHRREALGAPAYSLAPARAGGLWVGTGAGLVRATSSVVPVAGVPGPVVSIVEDRDGVVWAATWGRGLYRVTPRGVSAWTARDGLPDDFIHALYEDDEGSLWIGSRAGLSRWKSGPIVPYGPPEGLTGNFFSAVAGDSRGNVWLGTWRSGLYRFSGGVMSKVSLDAPELKVLVRAIAVSPQGVLWFSGWNGGLNRATSAGWRYYNRRVQALAFDAGGALWLGTGDALYRYPSGEPAPDAPALLQGPSVQALLAAHGRMWAGTDRGLWSIEGGRASAVAGLPHPSVTSLGEDSQGRLWATTRANGITLVTPAGARTFAQREGLPPLPFYSVLDDGAGSLWLSSPAGIFEIPLAQVSELLAGRRPALDPVAYTQEDGMRTIECQNVGHPSGWKDSAGDLWFPTVRGAVRVRPRARRAAPPPAVVVESAGFARQAHTVRYTAPRLSSPARLEFRYRIEGLNPEWISAGPDRALRYDHLPAGRHTLLLAAREKGGAWGPAAQVVLDQPPRMHETWWFRLLALAAVAGALFLLHRWRAHLLRARFALVLAERNRIAREWHDTLLAGFSAISWQLDATLKRLTEKPETAAEAVQMARTMVQHYRAEARRVIWDLRRSEPEPESLSSALSAVLAELTRDRGITARVEVDGAPVPLPGETVQNLLRICQEAASNAILHGAPSSIEIRLRFAPGQVTASVRDDGAGFDPQRIPPGHFGLEIMRERARRINGELQISSQPGAGALITATVPLPQGAK